MFCYYADTYVLSLFKIIVDVEGDREWGVSGAGWWGHDEAKYAYSQSTASI